MPSQSIKIGPFSNIYVGNYDSNGTLTKVSSINFGDFQLEESTDEQYLAGYDRAIQSGLHTIKISMSFHGDDDALIKLSKGMDLDTVGKDSPPEFNNYSLFLSHPNEEEKSSIFIPKCRVEKRTALSYSKTNPTGISLSFIAQNRNRYVKLMYMDTVSNLAVIMGVRSPVSV
jgi:hypothetical protein